MECGNRPYVGASVQIDDRHGLRGCNTWREPIELYVVYAFMLDEHIAHHARCWPGGPLLANGLDTVKHCVNRAIDPFTSSDAQEGNEQTALQTGHGRWGLKFLLMTDTRGC